jgi:predicted DCC family thiol-disulfide oxidoreductase YuxK
MTQELLIALKTYQLPFLGVLAFALVAVRFRDISPAVTGIHRFLVRRGFSVNTDLASEVMRLELLRIVTGLILCHRTLYTLLYMPSSTTAGLEWAMAGSVLALAIAFTAGFLTPVAGFALLLVMQPFDLVLRTSTLGTDVLQMILLVLVFVPAGTALSLDAALRARKGLTDKVLKGIYGWFGSPSVEKISVLRFLALISYAMLCIYSVLFHLDDPAWMQGYANALLLSSSYLSRHYDAFREWFLAYPGYSLFIAHATLIGMMLWEALLLPMVLLHRITRAIAVVWGLLFFTVSLFLLHLGWLAYYEFVLWAVLFWQVRWLNADGRIGIKLLYDDRCNLCDRTVRFLSRIDVFEVIRFHPLSKNHALMQQHGIDTREALRDLYGIDETTATFYKGYGLYTTLAVRLLLLVPVWPVLIIGRLAGIGPAIYEWIAARRIKVFGVCERPAPLPSRDRARLEVGAAPPASGVRALFGALLVSYAVFLVIFTARLPHVEQVPPISYANRYTQQYFKEANETVGLAPINVFNVADLAMSEVFFVVERQSENGEWEMLPFTGLSGERLLWHESDRVYFGNSLVFRRWKGDKTCMHEWQSRYVLELVAISEAETGSRGGIYRFRYFKQPLPDTEELKRYRFAYPGIHPTCEVEYDAGGHRILHVVEKDGLQQPGAGHKAQP